jgi:hypothetical protein
LRRALDIEGMRSLQTDRAEDRTPDNGFWEAFGSALAALARGTGFSASGCPLPEVREAARDIRELRRQPSDPNHRIAA